MRKSVHLVGYSHVQFALFGGSKVSPSRPSDRSSIKTKMSPED